MYKNTFLLQMVKYSSQQACAGYLACFWSIWTENKNKNWAEFCSCKRAIFFIMSATKPCNFVVQKAINFFTINICNQQHLIKTFSIAKSSVGTTASIQSPETDDNVNGKDILILIFSVFHAYSLLEIKTFLRLIDLPLDLGLPLAIIKKLQCVRKLITAF